MDGLLIVLLVIMVIAAFAGGAWLWMRHHYAKSIEARGWRFSRSPSIGITVGLNAAPFGVGFSRTVDDQVLGTGPAGIPFQAFRYTSDAYRSSGYVVTMKLPKSLPNVVAFHPDSPRAGVSGSRLSSTPLHVVARRPEFAREFASAVLPAVPALTTSQGQPMVIDVGVDHDSLVMLHVPRKPADLALAVAWLERVHQSLTSSHAMAFEGAPPPSHLSFQDRDHWVYTPRDDSMLKPGQPYGWRLRSLRRRRHHLQQSGCAVHPDDTHLEDPPHAQGLQGQHHQLHQESQRGHRGVPDLIPLPSGVGELGDVQGLRWQCRAVRVHRVQPDVQGALPPPTLRLRRVPPAPAGVLHTHGSARVQHRARRAHPCGGWDMVPRRLDRASEFLHGFFSRIPNFAWKELGAWPRPIAEIEHYTP